MSDQPAYYAIIPASVRYADIAPNAKLLYGELTALSSKEGYCWASNAYFANLYKVGNDTVSDWIFQLKEAGFIKTEVNRDAGNTRKIWLTMGILPHTLSGKIPRPYREKAEHINTVSIKGKNTETKVSDLPFLVVEETTKVVKPPRDKRAWELREKLYTMFEKDTGTRPTPTMADYVRIVEALKSLEPKHIEEMIENALSYGGEKTVREVLTSRKIDIYRQENI